MRRGFTLIELLVASLLLGMLVTMLTMLFNSSAVAWRTGTAGVAQLDDVRESLGTFQDIRDNVLPGLGDKNASVGSGDSRSIRYRVVSLWDPEQDALRTDRAFNKDKSIEWGSAPQFTIQEARTGEKCSGGAMSQQSGQSAGLFTVGVRSAGPDRTFGTDDDVSTWPDEVE